MFPPYHQFANCQRLRNQVEQLYKLGAVPEDLYAEHNKYHYSLVHKLHCARHYLDQLEHVLTNTPVEELINESNDFLFQVNMHLDGFFYAGGSALDILAREILVYFGIQLPNSVYFKTARELLNVQRPGDAIIARLQDPGWKSAYTNYRNALTHELLIAGQYLITVTVVGARQKRNVVFPLPDDPRVSIDARTYNQNPDLLVYCRDHMRRLISLINTIYGDLYPRMALAGSLPI